MPRTDEANQQIREQRKAQIVAAAARVFARQGLAATRIADIAAAAGMSQGLIYRYFAAKEDVFAEIIAQATCLTPQLAEYARAGPGTPWDKLIWLTSQLLPYQYQQPDYSLVLLHALINETVPGAVRAVALRHSDTLLATFSRLIEAGQAAGQVRPAPPQQLAILYLATLQGLAAGAAFLEYAPAGFPDVAAVLQMLKADPDPLAKEHP